MADKLPGLYQRGDCAALFQQGLQQSIRVRSNQSEAVKGAITRSPSRAAQTEPREGQQAGSGPGGRGQLKTQACGPFSSSFSFLQLHCVHWQHFQKQGRHIHSPGLYSRHPHTRLIKPWSLPGSSWEGAKTEDSECEGPLQRLYSSRGGGQTGRMDLLQTSSHPQGHKVSGRSRVHLGICPWEKLAPQVSGTF